ncbi:MAG: hypothetical protein HRU50_15395 [Winogradskyella sp.]|uniref:hypothetical protein n=1 Tax=Winogradskyella sp. TaxID=1883156 RepID=UPI0025E323AB|nr:hypothetical protein [Winogradskyella sp.]NRB61306.1 hypothetical protein [Winogradskyella sp.]
MDIIGAFFTILTILFVVLPTIGIVLLIRYVIKKSKADQPKHVLEKEQHDMLAKARSKKHKLSQWQKQSIEEISNDLNFNYVKGFTRRFNGYIKSLNGESLLYFRRLDRGQFKTTSKIIAIASNFEIFYSQTQEEISVYVNEAFFGKISPGKIFNSKQELIGTHNRMTSGKPYYEVVLNDQRIAYVLKNTERRTLLKNPFHDARPSNPLEVDVFEQNPVSINEMIQLCKAPDDYEYHWLRCIVIYEIIYYGIDFLQ